MKKKDLEIHDKEQIDKEDIQEEENNIELFNIRDDDTIISIPLSEANESDIDEKEFTKLSIHSEKFINNLNLSFNIVLAYGIAALCFILVGTGLGHHNFLPFKIQKVSKWATQFGYAIFLASYWTSNMILLRIMTIVGYIFFILSAFLSDLTPYLDVLTWTFIFVMLNLQQIIKLFYDKRPIVFDAFREKIYVSMFDGIMSRSDFKSLTKNSLLRDLCKNRFYTKNGDRCSNLSILIYGKMKIIYPKKKNINNASLYDDEEETSNTIFIKDNEFIDSPQWMLRKNKKKGKRFTYSIMAETDCKYLTWSREFLIELLEKKPDLEQPLLGALGIDVSGKVLGNSLDF
jgi:hypothetical protein